MEPHFIANSERHNITKEDLQGKLLEMKRLIDQQKQL